ncbi:MAG TPA: S49 family peptidase, partial [Nitrospirota bacterium]|nr:S49 family peptidase [Nitrospirota bacterium]
MSGNERIRGTGACSLIFFMFLFTGIATGIYYWFVAGRVPNRVVLEADFEQGLIEYLPEDASARFLLSKRLCVRDVVEALQKASGDDRVRGLIARVGESKMTLAQVQEVRAAVISFRMAGKPALAYAETFGEAGPGNSSYYLATAFDEVYLQPSGDVGLTGLMYEQPFFRGTLDKLGIIPRLDGRKEYKSFRYQFTERKYLPPHRESVEQVMKSRFGQMVRGIAETRKLSEDEVRSLIDRGPFIGREAVDAKLVEGLAYRDQVYDRIKEKAGAKAEFLTIGDYRKRAGGPYEKGATVALIYGVGAIMRGKSGYNPATGEIIMGSD